MVLVLGTHRLKVHVPDASKLSSPCYVRFLLMDSFSTGMKVVLDLTPNYEGQLSWFDSVMAVTDKMKVGYNSVCVCVICRITFQLCRS